MITTLGAGRFELKRLIGRGGMGRVYQAYDRELESDVALKTMSYINAEGILLFKNEFRALSGIHHPNLVELYQLFADENELFFTMELLDAVDFLEYVGTVPSNTTTGASTRQLWPNRAHASAGATCGATPLHTGTSKSSSLSTERLCHALFGLTRGIEALHASGHLHRDIKPSNVMVTRTGRVVLLDFGVILALSNTGAADSTGVVGTPAYMSPEQSTEGAIVTRKSDWYSVGVLLYEALTGEIPFSGGTESMLRAKKIGPVHPRNYLKIPASFFQLCARLLDPDPDRRPGAREIKRAVRTRRTTKGFAAQRPDVEALFGRRRELAELERMLVAAHRGVGASALVVGRSGIGKTALVKEFLRQASTDETLVLSGRCYEHESVPYKALDSLVDSLSRWLSRLSDELVRTLLPPEAYAVATAFPVLRRVAALDEAYRIAESVGRDPSEIRREAFDGLRTLFRAVASIQPVVMFVDDLQWGDVDSASLLCDLVRGLGAPILFLGCYRDEDRASSKLLKELRLATTSLPSQRFRHIKVRRLAQSDSYPLAISLLEKFGASSDTAAAIARASGGNPLLVQELARHVASSATTSGLDGVEIKQMIRWRVEQLAADARRLLRLTALAGKPTDLGILRRAAGLERAAPLVLADLHRMALIRTSGHDGGDRIEVFHDRIRSGIVEGLTPTTMRELHRRLAVEIQLCDNSNYESLAVHYAGAGESVLAFSYAHKAAVAANETLAFERAAALYKLARKLAGDSNHARTMELARAHGDALVNSGHTAEAAEIYEQAAAHAPAQLASALRTASGAAYLRSGYIDRGFTVLEPVLAELGIDLAPSPSRALARAAIRRVLVRLRGVRFRERTEEQLSPALRARIDAHWKVAGVLGMVDTVRGADAQAQHVLLALRSGDMLRIGRALALEVAYSCLAGARAEPRVRRLLSVVTDVANRTDDALLHAVANSLAGLAAYQRGEMLECLERVRSSAEVMRQRCVGTSWEQTNAHLYWTWSLYWLGSWRALHDRTRELVRSARARGDRYAIVSLTTGVSGFHLVARGRIGKARRLANEALRTWGRSGYNLQHYWASFTLVSCALYEGNEQTALALVDEQFVSLGRTFLLSVSMVRFEARHLRGRCALAAAEDHHAHRAAHWLRRANKDARAIRAMRMGALAGLGTLLAAGVAYQRGNATRALTMLKQAELELRRNGIAMFAAAARMQLGRLHGGWRGIALAADGAQAMSNVGVVDPVRLANLFAPGFRKRTTCSVR